MRHQPHPTSDPGLKARYGALLDIARTLAGTLRPDELYRAIYEQTSRVLETTGFYVSLYDAATDTATVVFYADRGTIEESVGITYRGMESSAIRQMRPVLERIDRFDNAILILGETDEEITRCTVSAPVVREGKVLGVISAQSYRPDAYTERDLELLSAVADLAAVALDNARYIQELERRRREAERLEEIGRAVTASLELPKVLRRITSAARDLAGADSATVWLIRDDDTLEIAMSTGEDDLPIGKTYLIPPALRERILNNRESMVLNDVPNHPMLSSDLRARLGIESAITVPLVVDDHVFGALAAGHATRRQYRDEDIRQLERLAYQAAIAVENARLHRQIRTLSLTDPLTGLPNRRHLEMVLDKEFAAARRGRELTIVLFDLDYFKRYNDSAGHSAGDEALRAFGRILTSQTRTMNLAARFGGDEFICILSDTDLDGGHTHARRIDRSVDDHPVLGQIGVSAGIASYSQDVDTPSDLIDRADHDLYRRKRDRDQKGSTAGNG